MDKLKKATLVLFTILLPFFSISQGKVLDRYFSFGPSISTYKGDLNTSYKKKSGGFNFMIIPERDKLIQTSLEMNIGQVTGENRDYFSETFPENEPNTFFQTNFASFSLNIRAYIYRKNNLKIYLGQGLGALRYTPKDVNNINLIDSITTRHSSDDFNSNLTIILPRTIGASYKLKNDYRVSLDINQQAPRTDYIDNISKLGISKKKDKILLIRFSVMIPLIYKRLE